jgi:hypothetical protein
VGGALLKYAESQRQDVLDGVSETARLAKKVYDDAASGAGDAELTADIAEYWSACLHYAAAVATNYGFLVAALGLEIRAGAVDSDTPTRVIDLDPAVTTPPVCIAFWMVGDGAWATTKLDASWVTFSQTIEQIGTGRWTIGFNLKAHPARGTYYVEYDVPGTPALSPELIHYYLDPQAPGS